MGSHRSKLFAQAAASVSTSSANAAGPADRYVGMYMAMGLRFRRFIALL